MELNILCESPCTLKRDSSRSEKKTIKKSNAHAPHLTLTHMCRALEPLTILGNHNFQVSVGPH